MNREIKHMTVSEFIEKRNNIKADRLKPKIELVTSYLSFTEKLELVKRVTDCSMFEIDEKGKKTGKVSINSIFMYLFFTLSIVDKYTNLDIKFNDVHNEYDLLKKNGLLDEIVCLDLNNPGLIPINEYSELKSYLDMETNDILQNNLSMQSFISNQVERFGTLIGITLEPVIDKLTNAIENMDDKQIENIGKKFDKFLNKVTK